MAVWEQEQGRVEIVDAHDDTVCLVGVGNLPSVTTDARLIAAAPDLLGDVDTVLKAAWLERLLSLASRFEPALWERIAPSVERFLADAHAHRAKATGETGGDL